VIVIGRNTHAGVVAALAQALGVSESYLRDEGGVTLAGVEFRTKASMTVKERAHVQTEVLEWIERYLRLEGMLELDSARWQCPVSMRKLARVREAEGVAEAVREAWRLGADAVPNVTELLEEKGLKVLTVRLPDAVSGFKCDVLRADGAPAVPAIVVNNQHTLERRRLTLAHELAHCVIDTTGLPYWDEEKAANWFAGAFLMPREHVVREVGKARKALGYQELVDLKHVYGVSGAALLMRLQSLDIISQSTVSYAFQTVARGWRTREPEELEPVAERGRREAAQRFERLCYRALAEGLMAVEGSAELLRVTVPEVEAGMRGPSRG
jgi:Zn-dependent peptidase ImmA (M78 family)